MNSKFELIYSNPLQTDFFTNAKKMFISNGFLILRKIIPLDYPIKLASEVQNFCKINTNSYSHDDFHFLANGSLSSAHNLSKYISSYEKIRSHDIFLKLFKFIYGKPSCQDFNSSFFAKPPKIGLSTKPHQDNAYFCFTPPEVITFWFPVDKSDQSNGGLYYLLNSDIEGNIKHQALGNLGASMCIEENIFNELSNKYKKVYIDLSPGDCVIHNPLIVHGSESNKSEYERRGFNFSIVSWNSKRNEKLYSEYRSKLISFLKQKK